MAKNISHHVIRSIDGKWAIKQGGASKCSATFKTQSEAISTARKISRAKGAELYIHGADGRIKTKDSYVVVSSIRKSS